MLFAVFALLMPSKLCFPSSLLACKAKKKKKSLCIWQQPSHCSLSRGPHIKNNLFILSGLDPSPVPPAVTSAGCVVFPPWRGREEAAAPASLIDFLCCVQVFMLKPGLSLRSTYLAQFLLLLHRKALTLLKYIEDDT